ncbi:MAG: VCBS repeat-containing protein [Actinobacteria bacterium]|nr:VCBS repeat-containing protein [Actinomycetota bacterium]
MPVPVIAIALAAVVAGCGGPVRDAATTGSAPPSQATTSPAPVSSPGTTQASAASVPTSTTPAAPGPRSCLPSFGDPRSIGATGGRGEPFVTAGDLDGDGDDDLLITRTEFATLQEFEIEIYLNEGGRLVPSTDLFETSVPTVQHPTDVVLADFNGDGVGDIFVADHGYDAPPHPGYQNVLVLSTSDGTLRDATSGLPQQLDFTHSAAAGDIDGDSDIDLFIGNVWGGTDDGKPPEFWINDGTGGFTVGRSRIPPDVAERNNGAYLDSLMVDVDGDDDLDLVLGDSGDDLPLGPDSLVLLNDGNGRFSVLADAMPPKDTPTDGVLDLDPIDLDGDGALDLLALIERYYSGGGTPGAYVQVLHNDGLGVFTDVTEDYLVPRPIPPGSDTLELLDLDEDGALDVIVRPWDHTAPDPLVWVHADGRWSPQPHRFGVGWLYYDFLDFDGDGDLDLVNGELELLENLGCR